MTLDRDCRIRVIMPFDLCSQLKDDDTERDRLPAPVVRALFGEPPVKLFSPTSRISKNLLRGPCRVPDTELCPWVIYDRTGFPGRWSAKRQTSDAYIPLSLVEWNEHNGDALGPNGAVGLEALSELIRDAPRQNRNDAEHADTDNRYNLLFTPKYNKQMVFNVYSKDTLCVLNGPTPFKEHCAGRKHCKKLLACESLEPRLDTGGLNSLMW